MLDVKCCSQHHMLYQFMDFYRLWVPAAVLDQIVTFIEYTASGRVPR